MYGFIVNQYHRNKCKYIKMNFCIYMSAANNDLDFIWFINVNEEVN